MDIRKIEVDIDDAAAVDEAFAALTPEPVACCNWAEEYPYAPDVAFRAFHTGSRLVVRFDVCEEVTAALVAEDNGPVWTDSCVEFFVAPDDAGYYNFETTCIGRMLLGFRAPGCEPVHAAPEVLAGVKRRPTLPPETFGERRDAGRWSMTLAIPPEALFRHDLKSWDGVELRVNLYKCGDGLSKPHFLSWQPIRSEKPNFHLPEFFGLFKLKP